MEELQFPTRSAEVSRETTETSVHVRLALEGEGRYDVATGIGFLDHMLELFARHGRFDLAVKCEGDLHVDDHHTVEDVGITLGQAFRKALGDKAYIARYGTAYVPMDEALARAVVDLSGRFFLHFEAPFSREQVGDLSTEVIRHFWFSFAEHLACNLHIDLLHGDNTHHQVEAVFKAVARALHAAVARDVAFGRTLSTKGTL
jgi:imidazoleglycerol-phosphate dehydratase